MNRRAFLKNLAVTVAGVAVGAELLSSSKVASNDEFCFQLRSYRGKGPKICVKTTRDGFDQAYRAAVEALKRNIIEIAQSDVRAAYLSLT